MRYYSRHGLCCLITPAVSDNYIYGESFFQLSESDVREMIQPLGLRKKIMQLIGVGSHSQVIVVTWGCVTYTLILVIKNYAWGERH